MTAVTFRCQECGELNTYNDSEEVLDLADAGSDDLASFGDDGGTYYVLIGLPCRDCGEEAEVDCFCHFNPDDPYDRAYTAVAAARTRDVRPGCESTKKDHSCEAEVILVPLASFIHGTHAKAFLGLTDEGTLDPDVGAILEGNGDLCLAGQIPTSYPDMNQPVVWFGCQPDWPERDSCRAHPSRQSRYGNLVLSVERERFWEVVDFSVPAWSMRWIGSFRKGKWAEIAQRFHIGEEHRYSPLTQQPGILNLGEDLTSDEWEWSFTCLGSDHVFTWDEEARFPVGKPWEHVEFAVETATLRIPKDYWSWAFVEHPSHRSAKYNKNTKSLDILDDKCVPSRSTGSSACQFPNPDRDSFLELVGEFCEQDGTGFTMEEFLEWQTAGWGATA